MNCFCESGGTTELKIEGDVGADPFWCNKCDCNLDIDNVPISGELAEELLSWAMNYGEWIDWEKDRLIPKGLDLEQEFNKSGVILTEKVKREIGGNYKIKFMPSTSASVYAQMKNGANY
ncbi:hypothetical protein [Bacillus sp. FSL K6-3431]|uniref:hypothetical protein n=1 Tax=Bacillus sp. FSL K6-3431 TaxID=2921500 RepID=UPI0030F8DF4F